jgi:hypothetical protein
MAAGSIPVDHEVLADRAYDIAKRRDNPGPDWAAVRVVLVKRFPGLSASDYDRAISIARGDW